MTKRLEWLWGGGLLLAALLGIYLVAFGSRIFEALETSGPYELTYGYEGEYVRQVSRAAYLRYELTSNGFMFGLGVYGWWQLAFSLRKEREELQRIAKASREIANYHAMFKEALDPLARKQAEQSITDLAENNLELWETAHLVQKYERERSRATRARLGS